MSQEPDDPAESIRMLTESASAMVPPDGSLDHIRAARFTHPGFARDGWATLVEMGWLHLRISEDAGGLGLGRREAVALSRVLGGGLVPEPYLAGLFALDLMEAAGCLEGIEPVLEGASIVVPAWQSSPDSMDPLAGVTVLEGRLTGAKIAVSAGADAFVVTTAQGLALLLRNAPSLTIEQMTMHDGTFREQLTFESTPCDIHACDAIEDCLHDAMLLHAGFLHGAAERAFDITLEYLRTRRQFDAAIGSFQALQHRATEIKVQLELARAAIDAAATALDLGQSATRMAVYRARARAGGLARLVAREAVQMHGAIGYTDEADIGLYVRRLMVEAGQFAPEYRLRAAFIDQREAAA